MSAFAFLANVSYELVTYRTHVMMMAIKKLKGEDAYCMYRSLYVKPKMHCAYGDVEDFYETVTPAYTAIKCFILELKTCL